MSRNNMELSAWGDGTIRLAFWDNQRGDDRVFILAEDGTAQESVEEGESEVVTPVDLVAKLRELAIAWEEGAE